jgi:hypothetical protein
LVFIAAAAMGAYALMHVEDRYTGSLFALAWIGLLLGFRLRPDASPLAVRLVVAACVINLLVLTAIDSRRDYRENVSKVRLREAEASEALHKLGVPEGANVARISPFVASGWARLARVHVVAEVDRHAANEFWKTTPAQQH